MINGTPSLYNQVKKIETCASFLDFFHFLCIKYTSQGVNGIPGFLASFCFKELVINKFALVSVQDCITEKKVTWDQFMDSSGDTLVQTTKTWMRHTLERVSTSWPTSLTGLRPSLTAGESS